MNKKKIEKEVSALIKKVVALSIAFPAAMFLSCVATKISQPYVLYEGYQKANLSNRTIVLALPASENIIINNPKDVIDDYGGMNATPESRIRKWYLPIFVHSFRTNMSGDSLIVANSYQAEFSLKGFDKKTTSLTRDLDTLLRRNPIPTKSSMQEAGLDSAVLLQINRLTFKRNNLFYEYYWDNKTKRPANLEVQADILLWDYKNDAPVFYGTITRKIIFKMALNRRQWDESAAELARKILLSVKCL